jgi:hypothetical protein
LVHGYEYFPLKGIAKTHKVSATLHYVVYRCIARVSRGGANLKTRAHGPFCNLVVIGLPACAGHAECYRRVLPQGAACRIYLV